MKSQYNTRVVNFDSIASYFLYKFEMEGQISDGKYENSRPFNHWQWINDDFDIVINSNVILGYYGVKKHSKNYNLNEWFSKYLTAKIPDIDWKFTTRIVNYTRLGRMFDECPYLDFHDYDLCNLSEICEYFDGYVDTIDDIDKISVGGFIKYMEENDYPAYFINAVKKSHIDDRVLREYRQTEMTIKDLKKIHKSMCQSINTWLVGI